MPGIVQDSNTVTKYGHMHTYVAKNGTIFNYNSDHSGTTFVKVPSSDPGVPPKELEVNGGDLREFGKAIFVQEVVSGLENL